MYHKLDTSKADFLTVTVSEFEKQIEYLVNQKYQFISLSEFLELLNSNQKMPERSVMLTFDDGYQNNFDYLLPVLKKHNLKATIFLPVSFIGKTNDWDNESDPIMNYETLKLAQPYFEYSLHSYGHHNMAEMTKQELASDIQNCISELKANQLEVLPVIAYPYGSYPKQDFAFDVLTKSGIQAAFRIGNKVNGFPFSNKFLIKRIDIKGTDTFKDFKTKVMKGRVRMF
jgi:peptidoglycan/xylan/chitin deacetylase (PgdA/CDA1 family)